MGILDYLILAALAVWGVAALRAKPAAGGCGGDCARCAKHCAKAGDKP